MARLGLGAALAAVVMATALGACGGSGTGETRVLGVEYHGSNPTGPDVPVAGPTGVMAPASGPVDVAVDDRPAPVPAPAPAVAPARATVAPALAPAPTAGPAAAPAAAPASGSIAGVVVAGAAPLAGAPVVLTGSGRRLEATTDGAGAYRFEGLAPGDYRLEASDPGDTTPVCDAGGSCITARPARAEVRDVAVRPGPPGREDFSF